MSLWDDLLKWLTPKQTPNGPDPLVTCKTDLDIANGSLVDCNASLVNSKQLVTQLAQQVSSLVNEKATLTEQLASIQMGLPLAEVELKKFWDNKIPTAVISYEGDVRVIQQTDGTYKNQTIDVPVTCYVTPNPTFRSELVARKLTLDAYLFAYPTLPRLEVYDKLAFDIKKYVDTLRHYVTDSLEWGVPEEWTFPIETFLIDKDDCEGWANLTASMWVSAGLPPYRLRCVTGEVYFGGGGHCTTYWLARDDKFHHLNSTSNSIQDVPSGDVKDAPLRSDVSDPLGIKNVWFSYNNEFAWHLFESEASATGFTQANAMGYVKIK